MANTIAIGIGHDKSRSKETHRLGSRAAEARAQTWRTTAMAWVQADGQGVVEVIRDGKILHTFAFGPEESGGR